MMLGFTKKHVIVLISAFFVLVAGAVFLYFLYVTPVLEQKEVLAMELEAEINQKDAYQKQIRDGESDLVEVSVELQRRLPIQPLLDQFILQMARAEGLSDTYILNININSQGELSILNGKKGSEGETEEEGTTNEQPGFEGLQQITFQLSVRANNYEDLAQFLRELDRLPRLVNIDNVSFLGLDENVMVDEERNGSLQFHVAVSTYYYPDLQELAGEHPQIDYPRPSQKENPLFTN